VDTNYPGLFVEMRDLSVPKIRFCNNSDEVRRGWAQMKEALIRAVVCTENLDSHVVVMQSAEEWL
jgi:hypothetical protein